MVKAMPDNNLTLDKLIKTIRDFDESRMPEWRMFVISLCNVNPIVKTLRSLGYTVTRRPKSYVWYITFQSATNHPSCVYVDKTNSVGNDKIIVIDKDFDNKIKDFCLGIRRDNNDTR